MTQQNNNKFLWLGALGVAGYFLYKKYGNPLQTLIAQPNNLLALQLPANVNQSYFVQTPQGTVSVTPSGVIQTGGIKCPLGTTLVGGRCVNVTVPPINPPPSGDAPSNPSGMSLS